MARRLPRAANLPTASELLYFKQVKRLVKKLGARIISDVVPLIEVPDRRLDASEIGGKIQQIGVEIGLELDGLEPILSTVGSRVGSHVVRTIRRTTGIRLVNNDPIAAAALPEFVRDGVSLITNLLQSQVGEVEGIITSAINLGMPVGQITGMLQERIGVSVSRARRIARDQVLTLNGRMTRERHQRLGITHYFWLTANDEVVRGLLDSDTQNHAAFEGRRFAYNDPPEDPRDGVRAHPAQRVNCRCQQVPDTSTLLDVTGL